MTSLALSEARPLLAHHPMGASTGYMRALRGDWPTLVQEASVFSPFAVELSVLSEDEIEGLERYLASDPALPFRYISIHGPSKGRAMSEATLVEVLTALSANVQGVVMHPDTIEDPGHFRALGRKLLIENMDARKPDGRTVAELSVWFAELPEAGFCFDIAHAWSIDDSMTVGGELLDAFRSRLRHLHVSSMNTDLHHVSLTEEDEGTFAPLLARCTDVPWILEAPPSQR